MDSTGNDMVTAQKECVHHWMLESPQEALERTGNARYSRGYCKHCGIEEDKFDNVGDYRRFQRLTKRAKK